MGDLREGECDVLVVSTFCVRDWTCRRCLLWLFWMPTGGFLRSHRSLTQTAGRAARNVNAWLSCMPTKITESMQLTIDETNRRREKQLKYTRGARHHLSKSGKQRTSTYFAGTEGFAEGGTGKEKSPATCCPVLCGTREQHHGCRRPIVWYMSRA